MPWLETNPVLERQRFVKDVESGHWTMSELCVRYGISRITGYKWLDRFHQSGVAGLQDHSRAPRSCPHQTPQDLVEQVLIALVIPPLVFRPDGRGLHDLAAGSAVVTLQTWRSLLGRDSVQS